METRKGKGKAKLVIVTFGSVILRAYTFLTRRPRMSATDDDDNDDEDRSTQRGTPNPPTRVVPKRAA